MPTRSLLRACAVALAVASLAFTGCKATIKDPKTEGYVPIFDGKTLAGWSGRSDLWTVKEGAITGTTHRDHPIAGNTFLVWTNGTVANFELRLQYRIFNGNSGIQYRSKLVDADKFVVGGYQADFEAGKTYSGILAERGQRTVITDEGGKTKVTVVGKLADSKELQANIRDEQWNDYLIVADGNHLMHFINGRMTVDVIDQQAAKAAKEGILALQIHAGPPMVVQFRDVKIKKLP